MDATLDTPAPPALPEGDYAVVELLGHRTLIGRIAEVERFGTKMIQIEPVFRGQLLPAVLHGGGSLYGLTPISRDLAATKGATNLWQLPDAVRATVPATALPPPEPTPDFVVDWDAVAGREDSDDA